MCASDDVMSDQKKDPLHLERGAGLTQPPIH